MKKWIAAGLVCLMTLGFCTSVYADETTAAAEEKVFDLNAYMRHNNDLFLAFGMNQDAYLQHYEMFGKNENRITEMQGWEDTWIGSCTTYFDETIPRAKNVHLATERINGKVLQPGELMSFSDTILSRTTANGYVSAPAIKRYEIGGGICQVSSTLYAAMRRAGMPAVERHPHSKPIPYLPTGFDATISEGYLDLKIQNVYDCPLKIHAKAENGALSVSLELLKAEQEAAEKEAEAKEKDIPDDLAGLTDEERMSLGPGAYYQ